MRYYIEQKKYDAAVVDQQVCGYLSGMYIVKKEDGSLFFIEAEEGIFDDEIVFQDSELSPITQLPIELQKFICRMCGENHE